MSFVPSSTLRKQFNVSNTSLQRWANDRKVEVKRMPGGKRLYNIEQTRRMFDGVIDNNINSTNDNETQEKKCYCYCRVSSSKQEEDLKRQVEDCKQDYPGYEIIQDIGSGLNYKRKGLQT